MPARWARRSTLGAFRDCSGATARRRRRLRRRLAHEREGVPARQVRPRRLGHRQHRLQRPLLHVVGGGRGALARSASIAACRFPLDGHRRAPTSILLVGGNPAETMPPIMQYFEAQQRGGGKLIVVDPRRTADGAVAPTLHLRLTPGTDAALANGLLHVLDPRTPDRRGVHRRAHRGLRGGPRACRHLLARARRAHHRRAARRHLREPRAHARHGAHAPMMLTARGAEQQAQGVDNVARLHQPRAGARQRSASRQRLRHASPARATARAAASTGRRPTSCPAIGASTTRDARAHMAAVWGVAGPRSPGAGTVGLRAARRARAATAACARCFVMGSNPVVSAPNALHIEQRLARSTCWSSPTSSSRRPRRSPTSSCRPRSGRRRTAR